MQGGETGWEEGAGSVLQPVALTICLKPWKDMERHAKQGNGRGIRAQTMQNAGPRPTRNPSLTLRLEPKQETEKVEASAPWPRNSILHLECVWKVWNPESKKNASYDLWND